MSKFTNSFYFMSILCDISRSSKCSLIFMWSNRSLWIIEFWVLDECDLFEVGRHQADCLSTSNFLLNSLLFLAAQT